MWMISSYILDYILRLFCISQPKTWLMTPYWCEKYQNFVWTVFILKIMNLTFFQNGDTALHISAALKRRKIAKLVVDSGIDINIRNKVGFSKFYVCYDSDSLSISRKGFEFIRNILGDFSKNLNIILASLTPVC